MEPININWTNDDGTHAGGQSYGIGFTIAWQRGAINEVGGRNGAFLTEVLQACRDQLAYFQNSKFASEENEIALTHLDTTIELLEARRKRREAAGTLGTHKVDSVTTEQ